MSHDGTKVHHFAMFLLDKMYCTVLYWTAVIIVISTLTPSHVVHTHVTANNHPFSHPSLCLSDGNSSIARFFSVRPIKASASTCTDDGTRGKKTKTQHRTKRRRLTTTSNHNSPCFIAAHIDSNNSKQQQQQQQIQASSGKKEQRSKTKVSTTSDSQTESNYHQSTTTMPSSTKMSLGEFMGGDNPVDVLPTAPRQRG